MSEFCAGFSECSQELDTFIKEEFKEEMKDFETKSYSLPQMSHLKSIIAPSMLSCDFSCIGSEARSIIQDGADWLHIDVMDGHFVPNITIGAPVVSALRKTLGSEPFLDCHLMVSEPEKWVSSFAKAGCSLYNFHIEATDDPIALIKRIKKEGMKAGIAIKPPTELNETLWKCIDTVDMVLIMTVNPGFGGQAFMGEVLPKVTEIRAKYPNLDIQVDGGIGPDTIDAAARAGANVIVAGSSIYSAPDKKERITLLRDVVEKGM